MGLARENVLALDAATDDVVVGLAAGGEIVHESELPPGEGERPRHAKALLAEIERAVEAGGGWGRVEHIGIGVGPGSFTGLRIGIATGRALAQARAIAAVPVGTLTALAHGVAEREGGVRPILAVVDARRGEVFVQLHDGSAAPLTEPAVLAPEGVAEWLAAGTTPLACGSGAVRFQRELEASGLEVLDPGDSAHRVAARHVCRLAASGEARPPERILPVYLREPDARRWLERDRDRDQATGL